MVIKVVAALLLAGYGVWVLRRRRGTPTLLDAGERCPRCRGRLQAVDRACAACGFELAAEPGTVETAVDHLVRNVLRARGFDVDEGERITPVQRPH